MLTEPANVINAYWGSEEERCGRPRFVVRESCVQLFVPRKNKYELLERMKSAEGVWITFGPTEIANVATRLVRIFFKPSSFAAWNMQVLDIEGDAGMVREGMRLYVWDDLGCQRRIYISDVKGVDFLPFLDARELRTCQMPR